MSGKNKHNLNDRFQPMQNAKLECYKALMNQNLVSSLSYNKFREKPCESLVGTIFQIIDDDLFAYSTNRLQVTFDYVITAKSTRS